MIIFDIAVAILFTLGLYITLSIIKPKDNRTTWGVWDWILIFACMLQIVLWNRG